MQALNAQREQSILVALSHEQLDRAAVDDCLLLIWVRWHLYARIANPPSHESLIFSKFMCQSEDEGLIGEFLIEFIDWGTNKEGIEGRGEFGPLYFVSPKGAFCS